MLNIYFNIEDDSWLQYDKNIEKGLSEFLCQISEKIEIKNILDQNINVEISILLTGDNQIKQLNKDYRNKDKATNILAFPLYGLDLRQNCNLDQYLFDNNLILGDLILSLEYIKNEAKIQGKKIDHHLKHLLLHGLLHLIGYDHIADDDRDDMEKLEIRILNDFTINNPYLSPLHN